MNRRKLTVLLSSAILSCGICSFSTTPHNVEAKEIKPVVDQNNFNNNNKFIEDLQYKSFSRIEEITKLKYLGEDEKKKFKDEIRQIINAFGEDIKNIDSKDNLAGINNFKREAIKKIYNVVMKAKEKDKSEKEIKNNENVYTNKNTNSEVIGSYYNSNYKFIEDLQYKSFTRIEEITKLKYLKADEKKKFKDEIRQIINDFGEDIKNIDSKDNLAGINNFKREAIKKIYNVVMKAKEKDKSEKEIKNNENVSTDKNTNSEVIGSYYNNNYKFIEDLQYKSFSRIEEITKLKYLKEDEKKKFKDEIRQIINDFGEAIKDIDSKDNLAGINNFKREAIKKIYNVVIKAKEKNSRV
ncbi:hypothetical protein P6O23_11675 [Clostridium perfringens]|nr:hypothetical protein [Clostridium perfringens]